MIYTTTPFLYFRGHRSWEILQWLSYLGTQDTYYVGSLKSVGRIYQQTFLDTYTKVAFAKLMTARTPW